MSISPSKLKMLATCPRWVRDDQEKDEAMKEAAEEGVRLHDLCDQMIKSHLAKDWDDMVCSVAGDEAGLITEALRTLKEYIMGTGMLHQMEVVAPDNLPQVGHYCSEIELRSELNGKQRLDFVAILPDGATAIVADFKFVRGEPDVRLQLNAYALTVMEELPDIQSVLVLAPTPKTIAPNYSATITRQDLPAIRDEIQAIIRRAEDKFSPGVPCEFCCTCSGNGRCPWQAATLRDIAVDAEVAIVTKDQLLDPATPFDRGRRRMLIQWLEKFVDAAKDQDKVWAIANPDTPLPGWNITMTAGRKSIDKARRLEACKLAEAMLQVNGDTLLGCVNLDMTELSAIVAMRDGMSKAQADVKIQQALAPVMIRGASFPTMRRETKKALTA